MTEPMTVLIVEDSPDQADLLRQYGERAGWTVAVVTNGEDALQTTATHTPDAVIIDLMLPGMGGRDLIPLFRAAAPESVIVVTSVLDADDFPPADAILPKPFTGAQVRRVLSDIQASRSTP